MRDKIREDHKILLCREGQNRVADDKIISWRHTSFRLYTLYKEKEIIQI